MGILSLGSLNVDDFTIGCDHDGPRKADRGSKYEDELLATNRDGVLPVPIPIENARCRA